MHDGQWLTCWMADKPALRPSARRSYQGHLDNYLLPYLRNIPLAALTAAELRGIFLRSSRSSSHARDIGRGVSRCASAASSSARAPLRDRRWNIRKAVPRRTLGYAADPGGRTSSY